MPENLLSELAIKKAKPEARPRKMSDGGGLLQRLRDTFLPRRISSKLRLSEAQEQLVDALA